MDTLNQTQFDEIIALPSVNGALHIDAYGEPLHSTIEDDQLREYVSFVAGMNETITEQSSIGHIEKLILKGAGKDNLILVMKDEETIAIQSDKNSAPSELCKKIEEILGNSE